MIERSGILPPFPKGEIEFAHGRTFNFKLDVVPRGPLSIARVQLDGLDVPIVAGVISTTMTEIDSPDERNVMVNVRRMTDEDHLLMVRSTSAHSLIE
jgi:hypothetical protein